MWQIHEQMGPILQLFETIYFDFKKNFDFYSKWPYHDFLSGFVLPESSLLSGSKGQLESTHKIKIAL